MTLEFVSAETKAAVRLVLGVSRVSVRMSLQKRKQKDSLKGSAAPGIGVT